MTFLDDISRKNWNLLMKNIFTHIKGGLKKAKLKMANVHALKVKLFTSVRKWGLCFGVSSVCKTYSTIFKIGINL